MKTYCILIVLVTLTAGDGCKKDKVENKPAKEKKVVISTVKSDRGASFAGGPAPLRKISFE
ncbi:MAG: hypothetical protein Q8941_12410 [Bacteroidota bacterium]|nr:hypothetical protein [Bacteroidota bacterium]